MDHLPRPRHPIVPLEEVPLVAGTPYDFLGFETFPYRKGFVKDGRLDESRPADELVSLMQSWLYFGLLEEILGYPLKQYDYILISKEPRAGPPLLCSCKLMCMLDDWQARLRKVGVAACDRALQEIRVRILVAVRGSALFDEIPMLKSPQHSSIALSVKLLVISLIHIFNAVQPEHRISLYDEDLRPLHSGSRRNISPAARGLMGRLTGSGWCPQAARRACASYDYLTVWYMSQLRSYREADHSGCTEDRCFALSSKQTGYASKHTQTGCDCAQLGVKKHEVSSIIERGGVPVVRLQFSSSTGLKLSLHRAGRNWGGYFAVSHVWSDGLGNPYANSLPMCQLKHLWQQMQPLSDFPFSTYVWMDTLCIPVGAGKDDVKQIAINSMSLIYAHARGVLVLDAEIQQLSAMLKDGE